MAGAEPTKCNRSFLNTLSSKTIRLAFFGMFRKGPTVGLDTPLSWQNQSHVSAVQPLASIVVFPYSLDRISEHMTCRWLALPRFVKDDQADLLLEEYNRLGSILHKMSVIELVRRVEIELSKNQTFQVMMLSALLTH